MRLPASVTSHRNGTAPSRAISVRRNPVRAARVAHFFFFDLTFRLVCARSLAAMLFCAFVVFVLLSAFDAFFATRLLVGISSVSYYPNGLNSAGNASTAGGGTRIAVRPSRLGAAQAPHARRTSAFDAGLRTGARSSDSSRSRRSRHGFRRRSSDGRVLGHRCRYDYRGRRRRLGDSMAPARLNGRSSFGRRVRRRVVRDHFGRGRRDRAGREVNRCRCRRCDG